MLEAQKIYPFLKILCIKEQKAKTTQGEPTKRNKSAGRVIMENEKNKELLEKTKQSGEVSEEELETVVGGLIIRHTEMFEKSRGYCYGEQRHSPF